MNYGWQSAEILGGSEFLQGIHPKIQNVRFLDFGFKQYVFRCFKKISIEEII